MIFSFLFFSREGDIYTIMLLSGLLLSTIAFLWILFAEKKLKQKIIWTLIVGCGIMVQQLTEKLLISKSYSIYLNKNYELLTTANGIMDAKPDGIYGISDFEDHPKQFDEHELATIKVLKENGKVRFISKDNGIVFYCLSGAIDIYNGIYYLKGIDPKEKGFKRIKSEWYW